MNIQTNQSKKRLPELTESKNPDNGRPEEQRKAMKRSLRRIFLHVYSQTGVMIFSTLVLVGTLFFLGIQFSHIFEIATAQILIRLAYYLTRGSRPVLTSLIVRKKAGRLFQEEVRVAVAFIAVCYLFSWPISRFSVFTFLGINAVVQAGHFFMAKRLRSYLAAKTLESADSDSEKQVIIIGTGAKAKEAADMIRRSPELDTHLVGFMDYHRRGLWSYSDIPLIGHPDTLVNLIAQRQVDAIIVAVEAEDMAHTERLYKTAEQMGVTICLLPNVFESKFATAKPGYINGTAVVVYRAIPEGQFGHAVKLVMDKIGAVIGLLLTSPLIVATAVAIKIESKGPVFFKQIRSGLNGKPFPLFKFRTMRNDAEKLKDQFKAQNEMSGPVFKITNDPRVTKIGKFLRKYSIDEVPQFINVLRGEMSLVGPRPPLPKEVAQYEPWQRRKLSVQPGVTCIWQVSGRNNIDFEDWMRLDLEYIDNWSLWNDTKLIAQTIPAVLKSRGAS